VRPRPNRPNNPLDDERARIRRGIRSGELTRQEVERLRRELQIVQSHYQRALNDGSVTPAERERLQSEMNRLNQEIRRLLANDRDRE
jgi:hypothetical protein